jgi:biopolymer transport protein ExbB/TolQ
MDVFHSIVRFFQEGGIFMYPIALILAMSVAIAVERYIFLTKSGIENRKVWDELRPVLQKRDYDRARRVTADSTVAIAEILAYGLARAQVSPKRDEIETAMEEGLMEHLPRLEKRTHYLASFANIATLLGLLGTIMGLIQSFTGVGVSDPAQRAAMLSAGISEAMHATAFGLLVAIPLLLIHGYLQTKTMELVESLETASIKFLNLLSTND